LRVLSGADLSDFFANEPGLVQAVFRTACHLAEHVPVQRLTFFPDERVWELIQ
jgi:hypothetical protein